MRMHSPSLSELHAFSAAARLGSYSLAAQELYVTQGGISRAIARLEEHLGFALFERQGFRIVEAGPCVGPVYMLTTLVTVLIGAFCPTPMRRPVSWAWQAVSAALRPLDRRLGTRPEAHLLASTTYLVAEKV